MTTFWHLICASKTWAQALVVDYRNSEKKNADAMSRRLKTGASILLSRELTTTASLVSNHSKNDGKESMPWTRYLAVNLTDHRSKLPGPKVERVREWKMGLGSLCVSLISENEDE